LFDLGAQVITTGNHIWDKREIFEYMSVPEESHGRVAGAAAGELRGGTPGFGVYEGELPTGQAYASLTCRACVMSSCDDPFRKADALLAKLSAKVGAVGHPRRGDQREDGAGLVSGRARDRVAGTHTHVPRRTSGC